MRQLRAPASNAGPTSVCCSGDTRTRSGASLPGTRRGRPSCEATVPEMRKAPGMENNVVYRVRMPMTSLLSPDAAVPAGCFALEFESGATACWPFSHGVLPAHKRSDSSAAVSYSGPSPTRLAWSSRPHAYLIQWPRCSPSLVAPPPLFPSRTWRTSSVRSRTVILVLATTEMLAMSSPSFDRRMHSPNIRPVPQGRPAGVAGGGLRVGAGHYLCPDSAPL